MSKLIKVPGALAICESIIRSYRVWNNHRAAGVAGVGDNSWHLRLADTLSKCQAGVAKAKGIAEVASAARANLGRLRHLADRSVPSVFADALQDAPKVREAMIYRKALIILEGADPWLVASEQTEQG